MFRVTTKRMTEEEIDKAIENLEKRGYRLLVKKKQPFHHNLARRLQLLSVSESWRGIAFSPFYIKLNFH